jgi:hypothetical protein
MSKAEKIKAEIERRYEYWKEKESNSHSIESESRMSECQHLLLLFDSLQEDPVSKDLDSFAKEYSFNIPSDIYNLLPKEKQSSWIIEIENSVKAGAQWQKANLWKPADGDDLPEVDREVIALVEENEHYKVVFAHRPPEYWDGKNILTGEVTRYKPKRYDKGGWNMPDVKWWLDCELPKMEE